VVFRRRKGGKFPGPGPGRAAQQLSFPIGKSGAEQGMSLLDTLYAIGPVRKFLWGRWYPFLTQRLKNEGVLFLNYAYATKPPLDLVLSAEDEPNRACIQLYHHVATQVDLRGKNVLEISCGHGGGASYLVRTLRPASYSALDLNAEGIRFCKKHHAAVEGLSFLQGDAENLPFDDASFDAVINVEASHCYPTFPRFLSEVARVLRPGGHFLYADFRFEEKGDIVKWEKALAAAPLRQVAFREINAEVLCGMESNAARSQQLIARHLPKFLHALGRDFAGIPGSRVYNALKQGVLSYRSGCFTKPIAAT
jgi:ubiquinone/menaquinone biosynthesis C-methylase UbiE